MSIENAILAHAAAVEKMAAGLENLAAMLAMVRGTRADMASVSQIADSAANATPEVKPDAELDSAVGKVEDAATQTKAVDKKALAAAKAAAEKAAADKAKPDEQNAKGAASSDDDEPLDYAKDVRPVLLAAIKKAGKETVQELIATYGVDKADKLDPDQYRDIMAKAQAL